MADIKEFKRPINEALVEAVQNLLEDAKAGYILSIAAVFENSDNTIGSQIVNAQDRFRLVGMLSRLQHRINETMSRDAKDDPKES